MPPIHYMIPFPSLLFPLMICHFVISLDKMSAIDYGITSEKVSPIHCMIAFDRFLPIHCMISLHKVSLIHCIFFFDKVLPIYCKIPLDKVSPIHCMIHLYKMSAIDYETMFNKLSPIHCMRSLDKVLPIHCMSSLAKVSPIYCMISFDKVSPAIHCMLSLDKVSPSHCMIFLDLLTGNDCGIPLVNRGSFFLNNALQVISMILYKVLGYIENASKKFIGWSFLREKYVWCSPFGCVLYIISNINKLVWNAIPDEWVIWTQIIHFCIKILVNNKCTHYHSFVQKTGK